MITSENIYIKFLSKNNKNNTNSNIKIPKSLFVLLFNEQKRKFLYQELVQQESTDDIDEFNEILNLDISLIKISDSSLKTDFKLPVDFLKRSSGYIKATKGDCKDNILITWFIKPKNRDVLLQNENYKPSFEYNETLAIINNNNVSVFKTDFDVNSFYLSYYKDPVDIDVEGYTDVFGNQSKNINTTLSSLSIDKILDRTVVEVSSNFQNIEQLQVALQRQQLNERKQ